MRTDPILTDTQLYYDLALTNLGPPLEGLPGVDYKKCLHHNGRNASFVYLCLLAE